MFSLPGLSKLSLFGTLEGRFDKEKDPDTSGTRHVEERKSVIRHFLGLCEDPLGCEGPNVSSKPRSLE